MTRYLCALLVAGLFAGTANAAPITVNDVQSFNHAPSGEATDFEVIASYDASGSDKLVVTVSTEDGWNRAGQDISVTYNGISMIEAIEKQSPDTTGASAIFYLDDPGAAGPIVVTSRKPNTGMTVVYALSGTADGVGDTDGTHTLTASITTTGADSIVIAHHGNSFDLGNGGDGATADSPLIQTGSHAHNWTGAGAGYMHVPSADTVTPTFSNVDTGNYATVAAEFQAVPEPVSLALFGLGGLMIARRRRA